MHMGLRPLKEEETVMVHELGPSVQMKEGSYVPSATVVNQL